MSDQTRSFDQSVLEATLDLLNKGMYQEARDYLLSLLGNDPALGVQSSTISWLQAFEKSFFTACRKHNVIAAFVAIDIVDQPDNTRKYKMITGGHHLADSLVSYHLKPLADSLGVDVNPPKPYLQPDFFEKKATWELPNAGK